MVQVWTGLPETKTTSLAFRLAIHRTLEINFREKLETGEDLGHAPPRSLNSWRYALPTVRAAGWGNRYQGPS